MLQAIKKQFRVLPSDWTVTWGFTLGFELLGIVLFAVITGIVGNDDKTWVPLGTLMACLIGCFFNVLMTAAQMNTNFQLQVGMGLTRKRFFVSFYTVSIIGNLLLFLWISLIGQLEELIYQTWYSDLKRELDLLPYLLRYGAPGYLLLTLVGGLAGALLLKYEKKAFWIIWMLWMVLTLGGPRMYGAVIDHPDSWIGRLFAANNISVSGWVVLGLLFGVLCMIVSYRIIRREPVKG